MVGLQQLRAPDHWRTLDFISDLHLQDSEPATYALWAEFMACTKADAVFILGDLFEVWVGDDQLDAQPAGFAARCAQTLAQAAQRLSVFFMHGNRDFLLGAEMVRRCGATLLADPCALSVGPWQALLSHGDALCLDDAPYLQFRAQVRQQAWQQQFLSRPLPERQGLARQMRQRSQQEHALRSARGEGYAEVDTQAAVAALLESGAQTLIHGHTHRPAQHLLGQGLRREVLSDWDVQADPPRAQVLRLSLAPQSEPRLERLALA